MATPKTARIVAAADVAAETRHLTLEMSDPPALGFLGGQYVIVDSGLVLPSPFGMSTRLTGCGRYVPSRSAADSSDR